MKARKILLGCMLFVCSFPTAQSGAQPFPSVDIYSLDGSRVDASTLSNNGMPLILVFFKTNENSCLENLYEIAETYHDQLEKKGVKMIAICIDCIGKKEHVKPFVYGHGLSIDVYVDLNGDFKRAMGVADAPFTVLYDQYMREICAYGGYCNGSGELVCEKIEACLNKMEIAY